MGGINSYLIGCYASSNICPENHSKLRISHSNRSFTFNKLNDNYVERTPRTKSIQNSECGMIDINNAGENLLMTLPGVNRKIAHDIVLHRSHIDGFQKIQDMALVNGIGAAKLKVIQSEITIGKPLNEEENKIYINEFDIFQMTKAAGISQRLAERIIRYRTKKGPFLYVRHILLVPKMTKKVFNMIEPNLDLSINYFKLKYDDDDSEEAICISAIHDGSLPCLQTDFRQLSNCKSNINTALVH